MSIAEIEKTKSALKDWIEKLSDTTMLHTLETLKATDEETGDWDALPESHRRNIMKGVEQAKNGQTVSSEEFWQRLKNG